MDGEGENRVEGGKSIGIVEDTRAEIGTGELRGLNGGGRLQRWLKEPLNLSLLGVLVFAVAVRIYYFSITKGQALWWDEAAYGSLARNFISHMWDGTSLITGELAIRPLLFPLAWSYLMRLGAGEEGVRIVLQFIPSVFAVFFVYLVAKEVYGKKVGLIASFVMGVLWIHLFYTGRMLTNVPALPFIFASVYYFIRGTRGGSFVGKYFAISLILLSIATLIRYPNGVIFFAFLAFLLLSGRFKLIKNRKFWVSGIMGLLPIWIFFLINYMKFGNIFPALFGSDYVQPVSDSIAFHLLGFIPDYLMNAFLIFFLLGLVVAAFELFVGYDQISKNKRLQGHMILLLILVVMYGYFIFSIRGAEDRWLFPTALSLTCFVGLGLGYAGDYLKKYGKHFGVVLIVGVLAFGAYSQLSFADDMIKNRAGSFLQQKQGFEWLGENSEEGSVIIGRSIEPYVIYYSGREYVHLPPNATAFEEREGDYVILHIYNPQPDYIQGYLQERVDEWRIANVFFLDEGQTQPALVIYQRF
jgi:4-amino-4-deoxy-L-arabinose transferase-like glycosyltransferase